MRLFLIFALLLLVAPAHAAKYTPATKAAFEKYVAAAEACMLKEYAEGHLFRGVDERAGKPAYKLFDALRKSNEVQMEAVRATADCGGTPKLPDAMLHHWVGSIFIPKTRLARVLELLQDYNNHKNIYRPEVVASRLLRREGDTFYAFLRLYKKKVIGVTLDTDHKAQYVTLSPTKAYSHSRTTKVQQVEDAGERSEKKQSAGDDNGFLWALNSYWRLQEQDGGVYIQCEAISISRDIPTGLGWMIKPFVTEVPKESLLSTLNSTKAALAKR